MSGPRHDHKTHQLTSKELEVLGYLARGKISVEIAAILGVSTRTITMHEANVKSKLGLNSTLELHAYAKANFAGGPA